jgi:hypothetical protein
MNGFPLRPQATKINIYDVHQETNTDDVAISCSTPPLPKLKSWPNQTGQVGGEGFQTTV